MEKEKLYMLLGELLNAKEYADALKYANEWLLKAYREHNCTEGIYFACLYSRQLESLVTDLDKCVQILDEGIVQYE